MFAVGDVVQLHSGGPKMTITAIIGSSENTKGDRLAKKNGYIDGDVLCEWFDGLEKKTSLFRAATIMRA